MSPAERSAAIEAQHEAAVGAYIALQAQAAVQIEAISAALEAHQDGIDPERVNWGHVGDLNHAIELLAQVEEWLAS
jgi:predicted secreted protein